MTLFDFGRERRLICGALAAISLSWALPGSAALAAKAEEARAFITHVSEKAIELAADNSAGPAEREQRFRGLLRESFDYERIAAFTLGPYRRRATEEQMKEFVGLLEDNVVLTYLRRFAEYEGQQVRIVDAREGRNESVEVATEVFTPGSSAAPYVARWLVQGTGEDLRIVDVTLESIRMTVTYRDDFVDTITRANGDIGALLSELKNRNARLAGQR